MAARQYSGSCHRHLRRTGFAESARVSRAIATSGRVWYCSGSSTTTRLYIISTTTKQYSRNGCSNISNGGWRRACCCKGRRPAGEAVRASHLYCTSPLLPLRDRSTPRPGPGTLGIWPLSQGVRMWAEGGPKRVHAIPCTPRCRHPTNNVWKMCGQHVTIPPPPMHSAGTLPRKLSSTTNKSLEHQPAAAGTGAEVRAEAEVEAGMEA